MNWVSGMGHETDFPSEQEKTAPWSRTPQAGFDAFEARKSAACSQGYGENRPFLRREALDQGTTLPASSLLKLNDFRSYRAPNPIQRQPLRYFAYGRIMNNSGVEVEPYDPAGIERVSPA